ncbi:phosphotransferase [Rhodococcus hoagii]|nr:phosphotransferase [Prescottella equi]
MTATASTASTWLRCNASSASRVWRRRVSWRARLISGGKSNLTFEVSDGVSRWVLRRPPTAGLTPVGARRRPRVRVCAALQGAAVPVAPRWCCVRTTRCWVRRSRSPGSSTAA